MNIKTTINIKQCQFDKINSLAEKFNISKSFIINCLLIKSMKRHNYKIRFLQCVQYQDRIADETEAWHCTPVSFRNDIYERCHDMKKLFKLSVSFLVSLAFEKYFDQFIFELENDLEGDNYSANYLQFYTRERHFTQITLLWDMVEQEKLEKIKEIHT